MVTYMIACGNCGRVTAVQIDPPVQGNHYCSNANCNMTIATMNGIRLVLKNGSKVK